MKRKKEFSTIESNQCWEIDIGMFIVISGIFKYTRKTMTFQVFVYREALDVLSEQVKENSDIVNLVIEKIKLDVGDHNSEFCKSILDYYKLNNETTIDMAIKKNKDSTKLKVRYY